MRVHFKTFESQFATRQKILQMAADFATELGPKRLISITHTEDRDDEVVTIWYWEEGHEAKAPTTRPETKQLAATTETTPNVSITPTDHLTRRPAEAGDVQTAP